MPKLLRVYFETNNIKTMRTIEELKAEEKILTEKVKENRQLQEEYYAKEWCQKHGVNIGDTISVKDKVGVLVDIDFSCSHEVSNAYYRYINKDGSLNKNRVRIWYFDFEHIKLVKRKDE